MVEVVVLVVIEVVVVVNVVVVVVVHTWSERQHLLLQQVGYSVIGLQQTLRKVLQFTPPMSISQYPL